MAEATSLEDKIVDEKVQKLWEDVVRTINRVLQHAKIYGFELMDMPDPDVHKLAVALDAVVLPLLDKIICNDDFSPESGLKLVNIRQYALHLREISYALGDEDQKKFDDTIDILKKYPMIV